MPGERRETASSCCTIPIPKKSTILVMEKSSTFNNIKKNENRERQGLVTTCIPLPKSGQFSNLDCNQRIDSKFVKTEKNRLRHIMRNNEEQQNNEDSPEMEFANDKEQRRNAVSSIRSNQLPVNQTNRTIPRYQAKCPDMTTRNADKKEETSLRRPKQSFAINPETTTFIPCNGRRVGVEGDGTPSSLHSWEAGAAKTSPPTPPPSQPPTTASRDGSKIVHPYHAAGDTILSNGQIITTELQSEFITRNIPTTSANVNPVVTRSNENRESSCRERWQTTTRANSRNHHRLSYSQKNYDMETTEGNGDNALNSGTSSPEPYARGAKHYDEDGSSDEDSKQEDGSRAHRLSSLYHGTWPVKRDLWTNQQMSLPGPQSGSAGSQQNDMASVMSFSSSTGISTNSAGTQGHRRLGAKVDVVYSLLGMLGSSEGREDMSSTLLAMSNSIDSCLVMRQSGCLPLLVQLIHAPGQDRETRERASRALHNVVQARSDEKIGRREARVLRLLEQVRDYCQALRASLETLGPPDDHHERHPGPTIAALMKLSFDEAHRHAMCQLGGLHAVSELIEIDHASHGSESDDQSCITLRRYAGMALTNLTFGDGNNKALLCSFRAFMIALVSQLRSLSDDLRQVTASVLRNLSWRADTSSKQTLREVGAVTGLMMAAMEGRKESTLKSILSALWNLSAHCSTNKVDICAVDGALAFLVDMLSYKAPSKTLSIVENAGGILRNVSSHIAVREDYRKIVRERDCLQVLLRQLRSPSLTVVSNACGALWNLSARCSNDQRLLWDLGAVPMLRSLVHSKHKMISMGSSAALKNLLSARPAGSNLVHLDSTARGLGLPTLPSLVARRQRALEQEIDQNLAETCDNIEPSTSPIGKDEKFVDFKHEQNCTDSNTRGRSYQSNINQSSGSNNKQHGLGVSRSDSRESMRSVTSTHSDTIFERVNRHINNGLTPAELQIKQQSSSLHSTIGICTNGAYHENRNKSNNSEKKYALRYNKNSIPVRLRPCELGLSEIADLRSTTSTMSWATGPEQESACSQIIMHSSIEENLSPLNSDKFPIERCKPNLTNKKSDDSSVRNTRFNYKIPSVRSPNGSATTTSLSTSSSSSSSSSSSFATNYNETAKSPSYETTRVKKIQSPIIEKIREPETLEVYAETDIDQPTNYSLRYAEINSDEDDKNRPVYFTDTVNNDIEDTVKTYCTEGTPYETPLNMSGAASYNDLPDIPSTPRISKKICHDRIDDVAREIRRDGFTEKKSKLVVKTEEREKISDDSLVNRATINSSLLTNISRQDFDVIESSESLANSDVSIAERSPTNPCQNKSFASCHKIDSASCADTSLTRQNSLVINDEQKIINDSMTNRNSDLINIGCNNDSPDVESSLDSMISDGDDDDEDLLAACIHIGMQNNRHRQSFRRNSLEKSPPAECNLARYQTSIALDQVEINGYTETNDASLQSDSSSFNIKMTTACNSENLANGYAFFEDNFNIAKDDDKYSAEYQKLEQLSYDRNEQSTIDYTDDSVTGKSAIFLESTRREIRANSVEDNLIHEDRMIDDVGSRLNSGLNRNSVSVESFDSVERSEQALLQLCIKTSEASRNETVTINENNSILSNSTIIDDTNFIKNKDITITRVTATKACRRNDDDNDDEACEDSDLSFTRDNQAKNVEDEYRRQRDPDAMIASLDRLTATLVQQTEAMRERESSAMRQSVQSDTWTEDSPNDVSYPSISVSAPLIGSFKSDIDEEHASVGKIMPIVRESESAELSSSMTNSRIIESEAIRLAEVVSAEATRQRMFYEPRSLISNDHDEASPSTIDSTISLDASYAGPFENYDTPLDHHHDRCQSNSLSPIRIKGQNLSDPRTCRKKSLPVGVVAKRALSQITNNAASLENLLSDCSLGTSSQLENIMPPSLMDEIFDNGDMENSMLSVASITSEIADSKEQDSASIAANDSIFDLVQPVANVLSITCMRYAASMQTSANDSTSDYLENVNPPSLLNEISDMDESTIDANTDTMCSETLCVDAELQNEDESSRPIFNDRIDEQDNDTDEAVTSLTTESCYSSSAESTPKKRSHKSHLTPKQKRQLAKERFKTYTIAAELVKKEEDERRKQEQQQQQQQETETEACRISRGKCSPYTRLTPKQRRQEDPARFQTQVLTNPFPDFVDTLKDTRQQEMCDDNTENAEKPVNSEITTFDNLCGSRTFRKKRTHSRENVDRYRTITLNHDEAFLPESSSFINAGSSVETCNDIFVDDEIRNNDCCEAMETMLEKNANIVLHTLNETSRVVDISSEDAMLDCETLSLVSNDSESEHSLRVRLVGGLGKKLMTSYVQRASKQAMNRRQEERATIIEDNVGGRDVTRGETRDEQTELSDSESDEEQEQEEDDEEEEEEEEKREGDEAASRNAEEQHQEAKRPRIVKPGTISRDRSVDSQIADKSEPSSPKGIRGRRKALYSTPSTRKITPQSSPLRQPTTTTTTTTTGIPIGRSNTTPVVRATRATTLRQNTNVLVNTVKDTAKMNYVQKIAQSTNMEKRSRTSALSKRSSIPQRGSSVASTKSIKRHSTPPGCSINSHKDTRVEIPTIKPLERQGTFTKDEPEIENPPNVVYCTSPGKSKIAKPTRGSPIRTNPPTVGKTKISVKTHQNFQQTVRSGKFPSSERIQSSRVLPSLVVVGGGGGGSSGGKRIIATNEPGVSSKCSNDRANGQFTTTEIVKTSRRLLTSLGQRSNSNSSIVSSPSTPPSSSTSSSSSFSRKLPKEATSKIASLWKKVEDSKKKQKFEKPDKRQWITAPSNDSTDSQDIAVTTGKPPPAFRLFRSSTFEGITQESDDIVESSGPQRLKRNFEAHPNVSKYRNSCDLTGMTTADAPCKIPVKFGEKRTFVKETPIGCGTILLRKQRSVDSSATTDIDGTKRISRLGSFIRVEGPEAEATSGQFRTSDSTVKAPISAIVAPYNYNPRQEELTSSTTRARLDENNDDDIYDYQADIVTGSSRVTSV